MENFKHFWTTFIGCIMMLGTVGLYFLSFFIPELEAIDYRIGIVFIGGIYLLFAEDKDLASPIKALIKKYVNKKE